MVIYVYVAVKIKQCNVQEKREDFQRQFLFELNSFRIENKQNSSSKTQFFF